jgi:alkylated DNA nucleotide flippase Atl1
MLTVATETTFESEANLHNAIASHPEVLPTEDVGLGPLVTLANELDVGHGPIDTLGVDGAGRLAIIEFKRGTENPDVRKVVAQVLDYGSSLWKLPFDELEEQARRCSPGFDEPMADYVGGKLLHLGVDTFDPDAFRRGVQTCLDSGDFVFLYVARDLDERTKRIMTYLAEGPRMTFFAVEVDYFRSSEENAVLVPRVAFVPSWVAESTRAGRAASRQLLLEQAPEAVQELAQRLADVAADLGLVVSPARASVIYRPAPRATGSTLYLDGNRIDFDLDSFRQRGQDDFAEDFLDRLQAIAGHPIRRGPWPGISPEALLAHWKSAEQEIIRHYFQARLEHIAEDGAPGALDADLLHQLLGRIPQGQWATYGDVAAAIGSHPRAVGGHMGNCPACANAWRVLQEGGRVSPSFRWTDPTNTASPTDVLVAEGVRFEDGHAHRDDRMGVAELRTLRANLHSS